MHPKQRWFLRYVTDDQVSSSHAQCIWIWPGLDEQPVTQKTSYCNDIITILGTESFTFDAMEDLCFWKLCLKLFLVNNKNITCSSFFNNKIKGENTLPESKIITMKQCTFAIN